MCSQLNDTAASRLQEAKKQVTIVRDWLDDDQEIVAELAEIRAALASVIEGIDDPKGKTAERVREESLASPGSGEKTASIPDSDDSS